MRLIQDIIDYADDEELGGAILFLDFSKAFDSLEWNFLFETLLKFKFGNRFLNYIKSIYNCCESSIISNGWSTSYFALHRGIRQGCPLSALLFLLAVEVMACHVRQSPQIHGINITNNGKNVFPPNVEIKISQVADDTTLFVADVQSITEALLTIKQFSAASGLKLNKSEGLWLGIWKDRSDKPAGLSWGDAPIKSLGIYFGYDHARLVLLNWEKKIERLKAQLDIWANRKLTLYG